MNRRRSQRFQLVLRCSFAYEQSTGEGAALDLSMEGCRMRSNAPLVKGQYVELFINLLGQILPLAVELAVIRWSAGTECGLEFIRIAEAHQARLRNYVKDLGQALMPHDMTGGSNEAGIVPARHHSPQRQRKAGRTILQAIVLAGVFFAQAAWGQAEPVHREQSILIPGVTAGERVFGTVVYGIVTVKERIDQSELQVTFHTVSGRFSKLAQTAAIHTAILNTARSLNLSPDSWNVALTVPYPDVIIGGDRLSGTLALNVTALARGHHVLSHTVFAATITPNGGMTSAGSFPPKLEAANTAHIRRVLVSDRQMKGGLL